MNVAICNRVENFMVKNQLPQKSPRLCTRNMLTLSSEKKGNFDCLQMCMHIFTKYIWTDLHEFGN